MDCHFITGVVGGVGKTMFARVLIDYIRQRQRQLVLVVEGDSQNSDIFDAYKLKTDDADTDDGVTESRWTPATDDGVTLSKCKLSTDDGWVALFDDLDELSQTIAVVNAGAQNMDSIEFAVQAGFVRGFEKFNRRCVTWWLITTTPTTVELLANFLAVMERAGGLPGPLHVVLNAGSGDRCDFDFYHEKMQKKILAAGGREVELPTLHKAIVKIIETLDLELHMVPAQLKAGHRIMYETWRNHVYNAVGEVVDGE